MASIHKEQRKNKTYYRLQFYDKDNRRRSLRLGGINKKAADSIRVKIEDLLSAQIAGTSPSRETAKWLAMIGDDLATKLTNAGFSNFVPKRETSTLGEFLKSYIDGRTPESSDSTINNFNQLRNKLIEFFGNDRELRSIKGGEADD